MKAIDPKYAIDIRDGEPVIVNAVTGIPIPEDEPLILFRARDRLAARMLTYYQWLAMEDGCTPSHMAGIANRLQAFEDFRKNRPERMKQPGITGDVPAFLKSCQPSPKS